MEGARQERGTRVRRFFFLSLRRLRWCAGDSTSTRQFAPVSSLSAVKRVVLFKFFRKSCFENLLLGIPGPLARGQRHARSLSAHAHVDIHEQ